MEQELEDEIQQHEEETVVIVAVALLLTTLTRFGTQGIPYNDLLSTMGQYPNSICLGALDGVHIPASVPAHKTTPYRNRKRFLSQNVLGVCNFGMRFMYMRVGWEGTAHDARVLRDAWSKDFKIRQGFFYLADAGYGLARNVLVPYRGTRYHLREQALAGQRPETKEELDNLRHSSL
ncbi:hypothetical protein MJO29_007610 [Puccinia striiformis f. sp. tritici]|nr:hypothetical protein MJO29_007610 [Puccinia striiformis f. sp. tritici]